MKIVESILQHLKLRGTENATITPEGLCPNCWGRTEYGGKFYTQLEKENIDINNSRSGLGWIQDYANEHFTSIVLKKRGTGSESVCMACDSSSE